MLPGADFARCYVRVFEFMCCSGISISSAIAWRHSPKSHHRTPTIAPRTSQVEQARAEEAAAKGEVAAAAADESESKSGGSSDADALVEDVCRALVAGNQIAPQDEGKMAQLLHAKKYHKLSKEQQVELIRATAKKLAVSTAQMITSLSACFVAV